MWHVNASTAFEVVDNGKYETVFIRFCTPVWSVSAPTAFKVEVNGKGGTVFLIFAYHINLICNVYHRENHLHPAGKAAQ